MKIQTKFHKKQGNIPIAITYVASDANRNTVQENFIKESWKTGWWNILWYQAHW